MDVESEGDQPKSTPKKKLSDGNAHGHPESRGKLPKSTCKKKPFLMVILKKKLVIWAYSKRSRSDDAMECWLSLLPESTQG